MQLLRTIVWVVIAVLLALFTLANWETVQVRIWEGLVLETKLPALVICAFLLGLVPMWLLYRANRWNLNRRIASLENTVRANTVAPPIATSEALATAAPPPSPPATPPL